MSCGLTEQEAQQHALDAVTEANRIAASSEKRALSRADQKMSEAMVWAALATTHAVKKDK